MSGEYDASDSGNDYGDDSPRKRRRRRSGDSDDRPAAPTTRRPLNECRGCKHTWYPKGRDIAARCPECGARDVGKAAAAGGCGATSLVVLLVALALAAASRWT